MPNNYLPNKDADLIPWLGNFVSVANANLGILGLIAADTDPFKPLQQTYSANLNDVEAKKTAYTAAVDSKDATKDSIIQKVRILVNKIQANPAVTPAMKAQVGISTHEGGSYPQHPVPPTDLVAVLQSDGSVNLSWNRNGNAPGTQFVIEYSSGAATNWILLDVVTKTNYNHKGFPAGVPIKYCVKARKGGETSGTSNIALAKIR